MLPGEFENLKKHEEREERERRRVERMAITRSAPVRIVILRQPFESTTWIGVTAILPAELASI
jgi:hypothetical protein